MRTGIPALLRLFGLAALFAVVPLLAGTPASAAQIPCEFPMDDGTMRECTFTERFGQCAFWAYTSYQDCSDHHEGIWDWFVCEAAYEFDFLACELEMVGDVIRLVTPL
jgi:hypothetical protein